MHALLGIFLCYTALFTSLSFCVLLELNVILAVRGFANWGQRDRCVYLVCMPIYVRVTSLLEKGVCECVCARASCV